MQLKPGFHMPLKGGYKKQLKNAASIGAKTVQIFSGNPTSWTPPKMDEEMAKDFVKNQEYYDINPLVFHTPYLINLASPQEDIINKSVELLKISLKRAELFKSPYVVTHIGSHLGEGIDKGVKNTCKAIEKLISEWPENVMLLLENTSGSGNSLGASFEEIKMIMDEFDNYFSSPFLGFCFDTAHAYGAGYDISNSSGIKSTLEDLSECINFRLLKVIHANDTPVKLGSKKDRHEDLFKGNIGRVGFEHFLNRIELDSVESIILETPKRTKSSDEQNLQRLNEILL